MLDALAPCRLNAVSVGKLENAEAEAEEQKNDKYEGLVEKSYLFQLIACEVQGSAEPSKEEFLKDLDVNPSVLKMSLELAVF